MQEKYNKQQLYIIPTIQNYLKRSVERSQYEIDIAKKKGLKFGAKLVRGAYIVEETELAEKNNT
jgi:proline dehydrogenase